jgi:hypothetical protein
MDDDARLQSASPATGGEATLSEGVPGLDEDLPVRIPDWGYPSGMLHTDAPDPRDQSALNLFGDLDSLSSLSDPDEEVLPSVVLPLILFLFLQMQLLLLGEAADSEVNRQTILGSMLI